MKCQNLERNRRSCACTYEPCARKGICCECLRYHLSMAELPGCVFSKEAESSYNRSMANFLLDAKGR